MRTKILRAMTLSAIGVAFVCSSSQASEPLVVGALGDSISAGFNAQRLGDNRDLSWSTGSNPRIDSHLKRLGERFQRQAVGFNEAIVGSTSADLDRQSSRLIRHKPDYVTITVGANDICEWDADYSDNLGIYEERVRATLDKLVEANHDVKVVLAAVPALLNLWEMGHAVAGCQARWDMFAICQPLLGRDVSPSDRLAFAGRWEAANATLEKISADYAGNVYFDPDMAHTRFEWQHISSMDCFHPSIEGQNLLADLAWRIILAND